MLKNLVSVFNKNLHILQGDMFKNVFKFNTLGRIRSAHLMIDLLNNDFINQFESLLDTRSH